MIIGAGLAGLIAAHIFPRERIIEAAAGPMQMHRALLRFRSESVSKLTGIPFKRVRVHKGIYFDGEFHAPNIQLANKYSNKCLGRIAGDRSIWNIDAVDRFVAPEDFYAQLIESVGARIEWGREIDFKLAKKCEAPFISTAPLPMLLKSLGIATDLEFVRAPITVQRFRVDDCEAYQTIYFPTSDHSLYRASITGNLLIAEFEGYPDGEWLPDMRDAFDLDRDQLVELDTVKQQFGKIAEIDANRRKKLIHEISYYHNIFSLGRFATWRNLLLDDVVEDAAVVKRLIHATEYDRQLAAI